MAITKAVSANPVRGYYVTTVFNGRKVLKSGSGFGVPRLGGLINARVDGLSTDTAAGRMLAARSPVSARQKDLQHHMSAEDAKRLQKEHEDYVKSTREAAKAEFEAAKEGEKVAERMAKHNEKVAADHEKTPEVNPVQIVKDPMTGEQRATVLGSADASVLDDPVKLADAEKKTVAEQKADADKLAKGEEPRPNVKK